MTSRSKLHFLVLSSLGLAASVSSAAPLTINTVGVYDSTDNANTIDRTAIGNPVTFTGNVLTAFGAGLGGVVNFDGQGTANGLSGITAGYGAGFSKTLSIGTSATFNDQFSSNIRALSGTENSGTGLFLLDATAGNRFYTFTLGAITGGAPGEGVTQFAFTLLARNGGGTPSILATATFSDATTVSSAAIPFTITSTLPSTAEDTFFGFTAPAGQTITSVTLDYGAAGGDLRRGIDDLAFITAVIPEPSTLTLAFGSLGLLLGFRRRGV